MELSLLDFIKKLDSAIGELTYNEMKQAKVELNVTLENGDLASANLRDAVEVLNVGEGRIKLTLKGETSWLV